MFKESRLFALFALTMAMIITPALVGAELLTCPECRNGVSSHAAACPKCGFPVAKIQSMRTAQQNHSEIAGPQLLAQAIILIKADDSRGTGFITVLDGKKYVVSNAHVLAGAEKIICSFNDGRPIKVGPPEYNKTLDMARMLVSDPIDVHIPISSERPQIGDGIMVMGNSQGAGAVTALRGKVLGIGDRKIEVDAGFVSGNSGSPVINSKNQVIGVATYATLDTSNWSILNTRFMAPRRFALTVSDNDEWVEVSSELYNKQVGVVVDMNQLATDMMRIYLDECFKAKIAGDLGYGRTKELLSILTESRRWVRGYSPDVEAKKYNNPKWQAMIQDYLTKRSELEKLYRYPTDGNGKIASDLNSRYRKDFGRSYSLGSHKAAIKRKSSELRALIKSICDYPQKAAKSSNWKTKFISDGTAESADFSKTLYELFETNLFNHQNFIGKEPDFK